MSHLRLIEAQSATAIKNKNLAQDYNQVLLMQAATGHQFIEKLLETSEYLYSKEGKGGYCSMFDPFLLFSLSNTRFVSESQP